MNVGRPVLPEPQKRGSAVATAVPSVNLVDVGAFAVRVTCSLGPLPCSSSPSAP